MVIGILVCLHLFGASSPASARENRKGLAAWLEKDTARALSHLERAARDSADSRYSYNLGTLRSLARKPGADEAFDRSLRSSRSAQDSSKILYNRGTSRLEAARGDPTAAAQDFRQALRLRPGWKDAARNLELALRLARPQGQSDKNEPKKNPDSRKKDQPKPKPDPQDGKDKQQGQPPPSSTGMSKEDADRMLDAARAQESKQTGKPSRKVVGDGPDW